MKRHILSILVFSLALQSTGRADFDDLPDPTGDTGGSSTAPVDPNPPASVGTEYAGSLAMAGLSRRTGGTVYTARLHKALPLTRLDVRVTNSRIKFYSVTLVTDQGTRIEIPAFANSAVLDTGALISSASVETVDAVASIELVVESFGGEADIILTALSKNEVPKLLLKIEAPKPAPSPSPTPGPTPEPSPSPLPSPEPGNPGEGSDLRVGDVVLYNSNAVATVQKFTRQGRAVVVFAEGSRAQEVDVILLEKSAHCVDDFCEGHKVQYNGGSAKILKLFPSGWAYLSLSSGKSVVVDMFFISASNDCDERNRFCVGDSVLYANRQEAIVTQIYGNDRVTIRILDSGVTMVIPVSQLAASFRCTEGALKLCVGDRVLVQGNPAVILGLYTNGQAKVMLENLRRIHWVAQKNLTKSLRCLNQICVGQKVKYGNQQAIVKEIYSNGTARVSIGILGKEYLVRVDSLRP